MTHHGAADVHLEAGQVWRCRAGGRFRILGRDAEGGWLGEGVDGTFVWRYTDDGRTAIARTERHNGMDLVELVGTVELS